MRKSIADGSEGIGMFLVLEDRKETDTVWRLKLGIMIERRLYMSLYYKAERINQLLEPIKNTVIYLWEMKFPLLSSSSIQYLPPHPLFDYSKTSVVHR